MSEGNLDQACPKLEESQRLDPATGTLLNLAVCHQEQGRIATAWTEFNEASARARADARPDRVEFAQLRLQELEPLLHRIVIELPAQATETRLRVTLDGVELGEAALGTAFPIDPGKHQVEATAPAHNSWKTSFEVPVPSQSGPHPSLPSQSAPSQLEAAPSASESQENARLTRITIPRLQPTPSAVPLATALSEPKDIARDRKRPSSLRLASYGLGAAGVAGLGLGTGYGITALSSAGRANCDNENQCEDPQATARLKSAQRYADRATLGVAAGCVSLALAVVLFLVDKKQKKKSEALAAPGEEASLTTLGGRRPLAFDLAWSQEGALTLEGEFR